MLWYFIGHPHHYWVPALANLILMILSARFFSHLYKGELRIMKDPIIIFFASLLFPFTDAAIVVCGCAWLASKVIGALIGKR